MSVKALRRKHILLSRLLTSISSPGQARRAGHTERRRQCLLYHASPSRDLSLDSGSVIPLLVIAQGGNEPTTAKY